MSVIRQFIKNYKIPSDNKQIRGGLGIADQAGVFKISFKNIFKEALAK